MVGFRSLSQVAGFNDIPTSNQVKQFLMESLEDRLLAAEKDCLFITVLGQCSKFSDTKDILPVQYREMYVKILRY